MWVLAAAVLLPLLTALLLPFTAPARTKLAGRLALVCVVGCAALVGAAYARYGGAPATYALPWSAALDLSFSFRADGLSLLFALVICLVGIAVFAYAGAYLDETENRRRFFCYLLLFMGAMLGVVLSENLIALFVFWEMTSLSSFLLIGFWHKRERSRQGALKALVVTASGGLALLVGFVMVGSACQTYEIGEILARRQLLLDGPWALPAAILVMIGIVTKSAQVPFHLWLPSAMEAPTPVSAYLHAATMVKAGLYLCARLGPLFSLLPVWPHALTTLGLATMAWGSWMALRQRDLKSLLAFSTVSQLGLILSLLAASEERTTVAGLFHLLNHAAFKGALFLLVGVIEHELHTRDVVRLGAIVRHMPRTWILLATAALAMAGVPPLGGFISKELFLDHFLHAPWWLATTAVVGSALTAGYSIALIVGLARGHSASVEGEPSGHDPGWPLLWAPAALVVATVSLGLWPNLIAGGLIASATQAAVGPHVHVPHFALWHGISPALLASMIAIATGYLIYATWWTRREPDAPVLFSDRVYQRALAGLESGAKRLTAAYMSGLLWRYASLLLTALLLLIGAAFVREGGPNEIVWQARPAHAYEVIVALVAAAAALGAVLARTRLVAILALGANGYSLALLFSVLGAPDLALTQVMVETVSVALFLAVFVFLPPFRARMPSSLRPLRLILAAGFGGTVASLVWAARGSRAIESISAYFVTTSVQEAGGRNVVNVILVDYRGLDTMGEITVLGVAALACFAIIRLSRKERA